MQQKVTLAIRHPKSIHLTIIHPTIIYTLELGTIQISTLTRRHPYYENAPLHGKAPSPATKRGFLGFEMSLKTFYFSMCELHFIDGLKVQKLNITVSQIRNDAIFSLAGAGAWLSLAI